MTWLKQLLSTAPGSIKGVINMDELVKALGTAFGGASLVGILITALTAVSDHAADIFTNPMAATVGAALIGLVVDLLRRSNAGAPVVQLAPGDKVPPGGAVMAPPHAFPAVLVPEALAISAPSQPTSPWAKEPRPGESPLA